MKIRIIKCKDNKAWYRNWIGKKMIVVREMEFGFWVRDCNHGIKEQFVVDANDCKVVEE